MNIHRKLKKKASDNRGYLFFPRIIDKYKDLRKDFKKYLKAVTMLVSGAYNLNKKKFFLVIATSGAGISMLGFSLGVLLKYVKHLESNAPLKFFIYHFNPRDGFVLAFISVSSMALLVLSASLLLYSRLKTRDILVDFHLTSLERVVEKFGWNPPSDVAWLDDSTLKSSVRSLYSKDSQRAALTLRRLSEGYQHFLTAFGGLGVLLWLDAAATLYLLIIILSSLIFYVKINKRASKATRDYENLVGDSTRRSRALIENVSSWPNPELNPAVLKEIIHESNLKHNNFVYFDRIATRSMTEFLSYVLMAVALGFLVLTLGFSAMEGKKSWASVVGYIVVLQMVMKAFKTFSKIITEVTRIYPGISRLYEFNKKIKVPKSKGKINSLNLVFSDDALVDKNEKKVTLQGGDVIGLYAPVSLSRYSITFFEKIFTSGRRKSKKNITALIYSMSMSIPLRPPIVPITIRELLGLPDEIGASELRSAAGNMARSIEKVFPLDPDHQLSGKDLEKLSDDLLKRFSLLSCSFTDKSILLVHRSLVTDEWLREMKTMLQKRILVICFNDFPDIQNSLRSVIKSYFVASADGFIVSSGSFGFLKKRKIDIMEIHKKHTQQLIMKSKKVIVLGNSDDDDEDDD